MKPDKELIMWPLEILDAVGGMLVADDLKDFPWHPYLNGDPWDPVTGEGHFPGGMHHGMLGYLMQAGSKLGALAVVGQDLAEEAAEESNVFVDEMRFWEEIAHPVPMIEVQG